MVSTYRAEIYSAERSNDLLGEGWRWSERHIGEVKHRRKGVILHVKADSLWFKLQQTNRAKMKLQWADDYPYAKMVMLTYFSEVIQQLADGFIYGRKI